MRGRQARLMERLAVLSPQLGCLDAVRAELPEDGILVEEVTQIGFAARLAYPVYRPRTYISPGYQDNLGWGYATALGVQDARRDVPVVCSQVRDQCSTDATSQVDRPPSWRNASNRPLAT